MAQTVENLHAMQETPLLFYFFNVLKAHPCCSECQNFFIFLKDRIIFHCVDDHILCIHLPVDGHLGFFQTF